MRIDVKSITDRQKLTIEKGLCDYRYIMANWKKNDRDFQEVYYDFYLKARWAVMSNSKNQTPYFDLLQNLPVSSTLLEVLEALKQSMEKGSYEFSLGSKLLHTKNDTSPIYDSKVRDYLSSEENIDFWWQRSQKESGCPKGVTEIDKILHDWKLLNDWYSSFLPSGRGKQWIEWFNSCFPNFSNISDVKKVDFIIFATN